MAARKKIDVGTLLQAIASATGVDLATLEPAARRAPPPKAPKQKKTRSPRRPPIETTTDERKQLDPKHTPAEFRNIETTCPKCGHTGPIGTDFGVRMHRGTLRKQSWCANCRAKTNYHDRPRTYQT